MMVCITSDDIRLGKRVNHLHNPIARAIQREVDCYAVVTSTQIHRVSGVIPLPYHARIWLEAWDKGRAVTTLTVTI